MSEDFSSTSKRRVPLILRFAETLDWMTNSHGLRDFSKIEDAGEDTFTPARVYEFLVKKPSDVNPEYWRRQGSLLARRGGLVRDIKKILT
jgi:hypothetical protein